MPVSIMLDAGHGGRDPGAVYNGRQEKDDVLKLVLAIGEILQNSGIDVEYTRTTDIYETPFQKATEANEAGVDFFISIHRNSSPLANQYMGVESLIYNLSGIKYEIAPRGDTFRLKFSDSEFRGGERNAAEARSRSKPPLLVKFIICGDIRFRHNSVKTSAVYHGGAVIKRAVYFKRKSHRDH